MVYEPYWHWSRISQFYARIIRMMSHFDLPLSERYAQPYIYLSDYPSDLEYKKFKNKTKAEIDELKKKQEREPTTDVQLYTDSIKNQIVINTFRRALEESSIDCSVHVVKPKKCIMCAPTNRKLFIDNLDVECLRPIDEWVLDYC